MPLEDYCANLKNYFIADFDKDIHVGIYTIKNGVIDIDNFIVDNQYFRIVGSKFNDGVYNYSKELELIDETFNGAVWAMSVPPHFIKLAEEADKYLNEHPNSMALQSESFGGYSYTRCSSDIIGGFEYLPSSISVKLNRYRRVRVI